MTPCWPRRARPGGLGLAIGAARRGSSAYLPVGGVCAWAYFLSQRCRTVGARCPATADTPHGSLEGPCLHGVWLWSPDLDSRSRLTQTPAR